MKAAEDTSIIKVALDVYYNGPRWMGNESMPVGYYKSCGNYFIGKQISSGMLDFKCSMGALPTIF